MAASGVAVAGNLAQGNWKGAAMAATGLIGARAITGAAFAVGMSMKAAGAGKLLGKIGNAAGKWAYNNKFIGRKGPIFGAKQLGAAKSGIFNRVNAARVGWSSHGGHKTFRISIGPSKGWWKNKEAILFRGRW